MTVHSYSVVLVHVDGPVLVVHLSCRPLWVPNQTRGKGRRCKPQLGDPKQPLDAITNASKHRLVAAASSANTTRVSPAPHHNRAPVTACLRFILLLRKLDTRVYP